MKLNRFLLTFIEKLTNIFSEINMGTLQTQPNLRIKILCVTIDACVVIR